VAPITWARSGLSTPPTAPAERRTVVLAEITANV
jgi:hypothetical protein